MGAAQQSLIAALGGADPSAGYITPFTATAWYGMRKRNSAYSGYCVRVQNANASFTLLGSPIDIGFGADGWIDSAALIAAYSSASSGTQLLVITWYDQSGNGYDLTSSSGPSSPRITSSTTPDLISSHPAPRFNVNPSSAILSIATQAAFGFGSGAWAVEAYMYATNLSGSNTNPVVDFRSASGAGYMLLEIMTDKKISFYDGARTGAAGSVMSDATLTHLAWSHAGGTGGTFKQFIGGVAQSTSTKTMAVGSSRPLRIGLSQEAGSNIWPGLIGEVAVYAGTNQYPSDFTPRSY